MRTVLKCLLPNEVILIPRHRNRDLYISPPNDADEMVPDMWMQNLISEVIYRVLWRMRERMQIAQ
jgi:hypothetical protein